MHELFRYTFDKWFLVAFILLFSAWEYFHPARRNQFAIDKIDLIAVVNLSFFSLLCKFILLPLQSWAGAPLGELPIYIRVFIAAVVVDFLLYWVHRAMHTKYLWKTHWFHHSVKSMNWMKGLYTSATHILLYITPQLFLGYCLFGFSTLEMTGCLVATYFVQFWQHANITVHIGVLEYLFVTPQMHRVHHSIDHNRNKNFGALFSVWDRLFGTYAPPTNESYSLGVGKQYGLLRGLLGV